MPASDPDSGRVLERSRGAAAHSWSASAALALGHALAFWAAFPPLDAWPLVLLAPGLLAWLAIGAATMRRALLLAAMSQFILWLWIHRWLIDVSAPGWPALAAYLAIFGVIFAWIIRRAVHHPLLGRGSMTVVLPVIWTGIECLRGEVAFDGYPWFLIAHPIVNGPILAQSADLLGTYFVSFLAAMVSGLAIDLLHHGDQAGARRALIRNAVAAAVIFTANLGYGWWRVAQGGPISTGPRVLAVQTNLPQDNKIDWTVEQQLRDVPHFVELTRAAAASAESLDLIVWPETMLPGFGLEPETIRTLEERQSIAARFPREIAALAHELDLPLLIGSPAYLGLEVRDDRAAWQLHYNSAYLVHGQPPYQRYDKCFLTPFGETMPYISRWPWLEQRLLDFGARGMSFDLDANPDVHLIELAQTAGAARATPYALAAPICFEDTMARVCRRMIWDRGGKRADAIINLSNDGWFGDHDAGREQHVQIARFRSIENRVPMLRCANTGMSVSIDSNGFVVGVVGSGRYGTGCVEGSLVADLRLDSRRPLYGRVGDAWAWLCLAMTAISAGRIMWPARKGMHP